MWPPKLGECRGWMWSKTPDRYLISAHKNPCIPYPYLPQTFFKLYMSTFANIPPNPKWHKKLDCNTKMYTPNVSTSLYGYVVTLLIPLEIVSNFINESENTVYTPFFNSGYPLGWVFKKTRKNFAPHNYSQKNSHPHIFPKNVSRPIFSPKNISRPHIFPKNYFAPPYSFLNFLWKYFRPP